ncbi:hypothetical protein [Leisingera sp. MMG026]|uniref:hypothetical protein n=1 Tax=Leisingera sp. MMG026 TaxID=2909982 RepID=UPI001F2BD79F|nr:hypothetical protein [Leisingera sp. MMG026]MCF6433774.1 hypothetical protein [Leisingera sp. MMG026]
MKILKLSWKLLFAVLLALSLSINVALFVGGSLYQLASSAFGAVTGVRTVALQHADEVAQLSSEIAEERAAKKKLRRELTEATDSLATERAVTRELRAELADPFTRLVVFRGKRVAIRDAVDATADRISKRAVVTSSREVGSMAGEAIPYIGAAVIVGATALELKDLCETLKDMGELQRAISPEAMPSEDEKTVCNQPIPTREELWEEVKGSPKAAWQAARGAIPTLEEIKNFELPKVDWKGAWSTAFEGSGRALEATKNGAGSAAAATKAAAAGLLGKFLGDDAAEEEE